MSNKPQSKMMFQDPEWDSMCKLIDQGLSPGQAMSQVDVTGLNEREKRARLTRLLGKYLRAQKSKTLYAQEIENVRSMKEWQLPLEPGIPEEVRRVAALMKLISDSRKGKAFPLPVRVLARLFVNCPTLPTEGWDIIQRLIEYGCIELTRKGSAHGEGKGKPNLYRWKGEEDAGVEI
jgi:hypothetical protein